ncbi:MAG: lysozyme family protein [Oscillospiraceae bacterium]|nr:lysozyme family protein [Oscillospiraceae bacterium]
MRPYRSAQPSGLRTRLQYVLRAFSRKNSGDTEREDTPVENVESAGLEVAEQLNRELSQLRKSSKKERTTYAAERVPVSKETKVSNRQNEKIPAISDIKTGDVKTVPEIKERHKHSAGVIKTKEEVRRKAHEARGAESWRSAAAKGLAVDEAHKRAVTGRTKAAKLKAALKKAVRCSSDSLLYLGAGFIALLLPLFIVMAIGGMMYGSDEHSIGTEPVSEEVHEHSPYIFAYACEYELEEYVSLIKAVMMQESGGRGDDPMQASECSYNTKYPKSPNGITDPEYSIDVGIQYLKECLELAGVKDPDDIERISLALQGYNFGTGYISWARAKYGGYSQLSAVEFSEYMAEQMGWDSYGDPYYVSHVLRYYSAGEK